MTYDEIGKELGVSRQRIHQRIIKLRNKIRRKGYKHSIETKSKLKLAWKNREIYKKRKERELLKNEPAPLCACGCKNKVNWCNQHAKWYKYINGHQCIGMKKPEASKRMKKNNPSKNPNVIKKAIKSNIERGNY